LKPALANSSTRPYLEKPFTKIGLVEWLKVKALSSSPSIVKKKKKKKRHDMKIEQPFFFETGSHFVAQNSVELAISPAWPQTLKSSYLCLPSGGITGVHHHAWQECNTIFTSLKCLCPGFVIYKTGVIIISALG
jgi:hypothetical protein